MEEYPQVAICNIEAIIESAAADVEGRALSSPCVDGTERSESKTNNKEKDERKDKAGVATEHPASMMRCFCSDVASTPQHGQEEAQNGTAKAEEKECVGSDTFFEELAAIQIETAVVCNTTTAGAHLDLALRVILPGISHLGWIGAIYAICFACATHCFLDTMSISDCIGGVLAAGEELHHIVAIACGGNIVTRRMLDDWSTQVKSKGD